jgi:hypothetical protein
MPYESFGGEAAPEGCALWNIDCTIKSIAIRAFVTRMAVAHLGRPWAVSSPHR